MATQVPTLSEQIAQKSAEVARESVAVVPSRETIDAGWWTTTNAMTMSAAVLIFGFAVLLLMAFLLRNERRPSTSLRLFGTMVIIIMTVFLVVAGYDDKQLAAPIGLMGTIVGYLLGRESLDKSERAANPPAS